MQHNGIKRNLESFPAILHVCLQSREETLKVYTKIRTTNLLIMPRVRLYANLYINTLYDRFYIGGDKRDNFKILIHLVIKANTTRPLVPEAQKDVKGFRKFSF